MRYGSVQPFYIKRLVEMSSQLVRLKSASCKTISFVVSAQVSKSTSHSIVWQISPLIPDVIGCSSRHDLDTGDCIEKVITAILKGKGCLVQEEKSSQINEKSRRSTMNS